MPAPPRRRHLAVSLAMFGVGWGANQFVSLLVAYHRLRGLSVGTNQALFGIYALGLIPALLVGGPAADRWGRRWLVRPAALISVVATVVLMLGDHSVPALYVGRFLAGIASGAMFAAGTAWVKELSSPPYDAAGAGLDDRAGARRAAIALSAGFGLGPVVTGIIGQWAPAPLVSAYLPHLLVMALVLPGLFRAPETVASGSDVVGFASRLRVPAARRGRFLAVVLPLAPWVFGAPSVAFVILPTALGGRTEGYGVVFAGATAGLTLGVGVLIQPLARRLDRVDDARGAVAGLAVIVLGVLLGAGAAWQDSPTLVVVAAAVLGAGYGISLVCGLLEVQRIATPFELGGLTAVYYALTYVGFALPIVLAELTSMAGYPILLLIVAAVAFGCLLVVRTLAPRQRVRGGQEPVDGDRLCGAEPSATAWRTP